MSNGGQFANLKNRVGTPFAGITLIALIITIIIMLILVAVTITIAIQGGLFKLTQNAADRWKEAQEDELRLLDDIEEYISGTGISSEGYDKRQWSK